ncbi:MAG: hypothetical protein QG553_897 [Patescibacteria group bacterium]|nr:hypothetical protein [Patescibacteria group bacterium]
MIRLRANGIYKLIETQHHTKVLYLDQQVFAWVDAKGIGEILVASHNVHKSDCVLGLGRYRLYEVEDEAYASDLTHLELEVGGRYWQGYLLLSGLPNDQKIRGRIIPTREVITDNPRFSHRKELRKLTGVV